MYLDDTTPLVARTRTTAQDRVKTVLGLLADQHGPELTITGAKLGRLADCAREDASRAVAALCREGTLKRVGRTLVVLDRDAL